MATTSRPVARPSRPITASMKRFALVFRVPRQTSKANILSENTSIDLSIVSLGSTLLYAAYCVLRSCYPLALKAMSCRSGPVYTDVFCSRVGSNFILNISRSWGICSSVSNGPALNEGGSTVGPTDCFNSSLSSMRSSLAPSSGTASPKTRLSERQDTLLILFRSLLWGLRSLEDRLTAGAGRKSLYYLTCKKSPSILSSLIKQLFPFRFSTGQMLLCDKYYMNLVYGTRSQSDLACESRVSRRGPRCSPLSSSAKYSTLSSSWKKVST